MSLQTQSSPAPILSSPKSSSSRSTSTEERYNSIADHIAKHILKNACDGVDSRLCLAFGTFSQQIKSYFAGFNTFKYATDVRLIGKESVNGFINEIEYEREAFHTEGAAGTSETDTYKSYAILKSSKNQMQDNLMYEYRVGQYINKFNRIYPCFLETYGLLKYKSNEAWENLASKNLKFENDEEAKAVRLTSLKEGLAIQPLDYSVACAESRNLAILIQHFNNFTALNDIVSDPDFIKKELMYVLFQLYIPLAQMKYTFTHYDLHLNNLYVYEPAPGKYIQYHYHLVHGMAPVSFKSKYMLKIIDYGSSYFNDTTEDENSQTLIDNICKIPTNCDNDGCGQNVGSNKHINKNQSNDLKALFAINNSLKYKTKLLPQQLHIILDKVSDYRGEERISDNEEMSYADFLYRLLPKKKGGTKKIKRKRIKRTNPSKTTKKMRGTRIRRTNPSKTTKKMRGTHIGGTNPSKTTKKMSENDVKKYFTEKIHTVQDAANHLVWNVVNEELKIKNIKDHDLENKLGDLHVYLDGTEMVFNMTHKSKT